MSISRIWKEPNQKFTWRHIVLFVYWVVTLIPVIIILAIGALAELVDAYYGSVRVWANHDAYWHPPKEERAPAPTLDPGWPNSSYHVKDYVNTDDYLREPPTRR